jgi:hypothetical protein
MLENMSQVQQLLKKSRAEDMSTGDIERYMEKPAMPTALAAAPINHGATAPAPNGRNEKKTIQNFFNRFIALSISHFATNVI